MNINKLLKHLDEQIEAAERFARQPAPELQYIINTSAAVALKQLKQAIIDSMGVEKDEGWSNKTLSDQVNRQEN